MMHNHETPGAYYNREFTRRLRDHYARGGGVPLFFPPGDAIGPILIPRSTVSHPTAAVTRAPGHRRDRRTARPFARTVNDVAQRRQRIARARLRAPRPVQPPRQRIPAPPPGNPFETDLQKRANRLRRAQWWGEQYDRRVRGR